MWFGFSVGLFSQTFLILRRVNFSETEILSTDFQKNIQKVNFLKKTVQWEPSCSMRRDRQT